MDSAPKCIVQRDCSTSLLQMLSDASSKRRSLSSPSSHLELASAGWHSPGYPATCASERLELRRAASQSVAGKFPRQVPSASSLGKFSRPVQPASSSRKCLTNYRRHVPPSLACCLARQASEFWRPPRRQRARIHRQVRAGQPSHHRPCVYRHTIGRLQQPERSVGSVGSVCAHCIETLCIRIETLCIR